MLVYIHLAFARHPVKCLEEVKETWPRDGILRVETQELHEIEVSLIRMF